MSQRVLHHEAPYARSRIKNSQNEERLKHKGEVVPDRHNSVPAKASGKDLRHAHGERGRPSGAVVERLFADGVGQCRHIGSSHVETPIGNRAGRRFGRCTHHTCRTVNCEVNTGLHRASGDHRHDRHHGLRHHGAVSDHPRFGFARQKFRCGTAGDQGMKSTNCAASDGDKRERKNAACKDRSGAVDEARQRWHLQLRADEQNSTCEENNHAQLYESAQVIPRCKQQPNW